MKARTIALLLCLASPFCGVTAPGAEAPAAQASASDSEQFAAERTQTLRRLAEGAMPRLRMSDERPLLPDVALPGAGGSMRQLSDWRGRTLVLHFWASWCAPCRTEIPAIARLEARLHDQSFALLTVSLDKSPDDAERFLASLGVTSLPLASDPEGKSVAAVLGARGLPTSILVDPDGREVGRLEGSADWLSDDAVLLIMALLQQAGEPGTAASGAPATPNGPPVSGRAAVP